MTAGLLLYAIRYTLYAKRRSGFTLVETLASMGILIVFLTATLTSFNVTQNLSETTQKQSTVLQAAKAKLEEMRAMNFRKLFDWYDTNQMDVTDIDGDGDTAEMLYINRIFPLRDSANNKYAMGNIRLTDIYDTWTAGPNLTVDAYIYNPAAVVTQGDSTTGAKIWVLGGNECGIVYDNRHYFDAKTWAWVQTLVFDVTPLGSGIWPGRFSFPAVNFDNGIFILGGDMGWGNLLNDVWYTPEVSDADLADGKQAWYAKTSNAGWTARDGHTALVYDGRIWVFGGRDTSGYRNDVWYSSDGATWTRVADAAWSARYHHAAVVFDNKIWVLGGKGSSGYLNDVWYSSDGVSWTQVANAAWIPRYMHRAVVLDGKIWVVGGNDGATNLRQIWYSSDGIKWILSAVPSWAAGGFDAVVFYGRLWILGGGVTGNNWMSYGADRMYQVDITVAFRDNKGRIIGEDNGKQGYASEDLPKALNGGLDTFGAGAETEDVNGNGFLDSPVHVTGILASRGYPSQVYLGRE
ncbi:MAG: kelch repeat-containing protein [Candidatus Omnitrophota bacterium]|nr:kelch repeat-containing protein [Candidatus Omnitrophota bacterium]